MTSIETPTADDHAPVSQDSHHYHPTARTYWITFAVLCLITALEVVWSYIGLSGVALVAPLLIMMLIKFMIVAGVFMHLQFDLKILNGFWFTIAFGTALLLALAVYMVVFAAFEFQI